MIKINFLCAALLFFIGCSLSSCQTSSTTQETQEIIPEKLEIAILMPLDGAEAAIGQQYNNMIKMGIEDGLKGSYLKITSYNASDERQTLASLEKIIKRNTKIILGPLYSPLTSLIAAKAKEHGIIIITMSNNPVLADDRLFVFGHAPLKQLEYIMNYSLNKNVKNFIALLPQGQHSQTISAIMQNMAVANNAVLVNSEFYSGTPESIDRAVKNVSDIVDNLNEMEDVATKPVIYLTDENKNLNLVFGSIAKYNLDKKAMIFGDNRIDIDSTASIDINFTGSLNILNSNIIERAKNMGIHHISFIHALAYDLGKMTANYIGDEFIESRFLNRLNSNESYIGISGDVRFVDGVSQRRYDIIRRENNVYRTLSSEK